MVAIPTVDRGSCVTPEIEEGLIRRLASGVSLVHALAILGVPLWAGVEWAERRSFSGPPTLGGKTKDWEGLISESLDVIETSVCKDDYPRDLEVAAWMMARGFDWGAAT